MPHHLRNFLMLLLCSLLLSSCDGDGDDDCDSDSFQQNKFVHETLLDRYLWYTQVEAEIDYCEFDSPEQTLDFLRYHELDRFSYIADAEAFTNLFSEGQYVGYGFSYFLGDSVRLRFVYDDSPAGRAGLQRGDQILTVNNQPVEQITASLGWGDVFGPAKQGVVVDMLVKKADGSVLDLHMEKAIVNINTVLHHSIIGDASEPVGYLVFNSFLSTSNNEFLQVFSDFSAAGVQNLILDLRYNGGGSVAVATNLASYLKSVSAYNSSLFTGLIFNDKHRSSNSYYYLAPMIDALDLNNLTIITTGSTASASEMIINGLKPYVNVKTVGSTSYGKPVGMSPVQFDDKILLAINFEALNSDNEGGYFDGIAADCNAEDGIGFAFGNTQEPMLNEALYVNQSNNCSGLRPAQRLAKQQTTPPPYSLQAIIGAE